MLNFFKKYYKYCLLVFLFCYFLKNKNLKTGLLQNQSKINNSAKALAGNIFSVIENDAIKKDEMNKIKNSFSVTAEQKEEKKQAIAQFETEITPIINKSCQAANVSLVGAEYASVKKDVFSLIENYVNKSGVSTDAERGISEVENLGKDIMPLAGAALMIHQGKDMFKKKATHADEAEAAVKNKKSSNKVNEEESATKNEGIFSKIKNKMNKKNKKNKNK